VQKSEQHLDKSQKMYYTVGLTIISLFKQMNKQSIRSSHTFLIKQGNMFGSFAL